MHEIIEQDTDRRHRTVRRQRKELWFQDANEHSVTCACGKRVSLIAAYQCFDCKIWFCEDCARTHFDKGAERDALDDDRDAPDGERP